MKQMAKKNLLFEFVMGRNNILTGLVAKQIQWNWPQYHDEQHLVFILEGLHTEMAALSDSGWTRSLVEANIASPGVVNSFVKGSSVKTTWRAHQVTPAALYSFLTQAYDE